MQYTVFSGLGNANDYPEYDESDNKETATVDPRLQYCDDLLNKINGTKDLESCCIYPEFVLKNDFPEESECETKCREIHTNETYRDTDEENCCNLRCDFERIGYLLYSTDPNIKPQTNVQGLINGFMQSENYNEVWEPIVRSTVTRCDDNAIGTNDFVYCNVVSSSFYHAVICSMKEFFLRCPDQFWNPKKLEKCDKLYRPYLMNCQDMFGVDV